MNKRLISIFSAFLILCLLITFAGERRLPANAASSTDYIRVGLKRNFYAKNSIKISNRNIYIGFASGNDYIRLDKLSGSSGFTFTRDSGSFAVIKGSYSSFTAAKKAADSFTQKYGVTCYPVLSGVTENKSANFHVMVSNSNRGKIKHASFIKKNYTSKYLLKVTCSGGVFYVDSESAGANPQIEAAADNSSGVKVITLAGSHFRGRIELGTYGKASVSAVNVIMFEDYLFGVVPQEMSASWPIEALRAQAVACRSFAVASQGFGPSGSVKSYPKLNDTTQYQSYGGYDKENSRSTRAVIATRNTFVTYKDKVVRTYFFSTSGGATEAPENVWGGKIGYLKSVSDTYETKPEKKPWKYTFEATRLGALAGGNIGRATRVEITERSSSGRALTMKITGTKGSVTLKKNAIRTAFDLPSTKFRVYAGGNSTSFVSAISGDGTERVNLKNAYAISASGTSKIKGSGFVTIEGSGNLANYSLSSTEGGTFVFIGEGYGHGVGMSQSGARGMAEAGFGYKAILTHYFTNCEVN
ncbi:MAG: SpoIID/LytB domain-containing protein [Catonella sp.]|nr:SpoIID/LytB domain-containing protein [Catonella sp.]MDY6356105.1 SpoIID/LytB domain-containing protein [Catonella sp.]